MEKITNFQVYIDKYKSIQEQIIAFVEKQNVEESDFVAIKSYIENLNISQDRYELKTFLYLILRIANHHCRTNNFSNRIKSIILIFQNEIKHYYSNQEIFSIFRNNKNILLLLFQEKILIPDKFVASTLSNETYKKDTYTYYFYYELKNSFKLEFCKKIEAFIKLNLNTNSEEAIQKIFNENRQIGENDQYICKLIRNDSIDEFKEYVKENKISLSKKVKLSIFETNNYLIYNKPSLIEYSAFFGSIKIFKYLCLNHVELEPSLWLYAVHSQKLELIHLLEENNVHPQDNDYTECLLESIKCHHQNITNYIMTKYVQNNNEIKEKIYFQSIKFFNFNSFPNNEDELLPFFNNLIKSDYCDIIDFLLKNKNVDVNERRIQNLNHLNLVSKLIS